MSFFPRYLYLFFTISCVKTNEIVNLDVHSVVDLTNQLVYVNNKIFFENRGPPTETYLYITGPELNFCEFFNKNGKKLDFFKASNGTSIIELDEKILTGQNGTLHSKIVYPNQIISAIKNRKIEEDQIMQYQGNACFFSLYNTSLFRVEYNLKNNSLVEYTKTPDYISSTKISYNFTNLRPYKIDPLVIIFVNNDPFLVVRFLKRSIDINHYGKISIEDKVQLENNGPPLTGPYHPYPKIRDKASTSWLYTHLPASAHNIQFFDNLGNSSQTHVYNYGTYQTLKFKPRYPLLGGWKTSYSLRYDIPTHEYLFVDKELFKLKIRAVDYVIIDKVVENVVVEIIFPEGSRIEDMDVPDGLGVRREDGVGCPGGLCFYGRPTIVLNATNLFHNYVQIFEVDYFLNPLYLFRVPIVVFVYLECLYLVVIAGMRYFSLA